MFMRVAIELLLFVIALSLPLEQAIAEPQPARPNFLVIVADDLGFSDLGAFGGEISTPNLDGIAQRGVRMTSFYTAPTCSPTRAMLLTGRDHHAVGMGTMDGMQSAIPGLAGRPGYVGHLHPSATTIAERLAEVGYRTMMSGKWHLGLRPEHGPDRQGFQQSFVLLQGAADHFGDDQAGQLGAGSASYMENGKPARLPAGRYSGDYFTERMLGFLERKPDDDRPFFAYMAFTQPHWPLQAPPALIEKYRGRYDDGPVALREKRLQHMKALGLLDEHALGAKLETLPDWNALDPAQRKRASRAMEVYAAMVESLDDNVGRLLAALRKSGELDRTVIVFLSDNGAEGMSEQQLAGLMGRFGASAGTIEQIKRANSDPDKMGRPGSYIAYGPSWAQAAMAPFHLYKGFSDEGGVRTPAMIAGPGVEGGRIIDSIVSVRDIKPTLLRLAGVAPDAPPDQVTDQGERLPVGKSLVPILDGTANTVRDDRDVIAWELFFRRGIRIGKWKAVYRDEDTSLLGAGPTKNMKWRLFDLESDPGESTDVSATHPDVLERLAASWQAYARENGVYTLDHDEGKGS
jgi:arylsulfatase A-like enzyme